MSLDSPLEIAVKAARELKDEMIDLLPLVPMARRQYVLDRVHTIVRSIGEVHGGHPRQAAGQGQGGHYTSAPLPSPSASTSPTLWDAAKPTYEPGDWQYNAPSLMRSKVDPEQGYRDASLAVRGRLDALVNSVRDSSAMWPCGRGRCSYPSMRSSPGIDPDGSEPGDESRFEDRAC